MEKKSGANWKTASLFGMHNLNWSNIIPMGSSSTACLRKKYNGNKFNLYQEEFHIGPVRFSYNPYFSACFFSQNSVFLSQQISQNNVSTYFFSEANGD